MGWNDIVKGLLPVGELLTISTGSLWVCSRAVDKLPPRRCRGSPHCERCSGLKRGILFGNTMAPNIE